jgi:BlaI family transcriptional regulator, penicillinase repressor
MGRTSFKRLGERELEVLNAVWELKEATVSDVRDILLLQRPLAYTTVMTIMRKLADKGYLAFTESENKYIYRPDKNPAEVRTGLLSDLVSSVFKGSPLSLVQTLVADESISEAELSEIKRIIDELD